MTTMKMDMILTQCNSISHIKQLQSYLIKSGLFKSSLTYRRKLLELTAISKFSNLSYATQIFNSIEHPSIYDWNSIIRGYSQSSTPQMAIIHFRNLLGLGGKPDGVTCSFVLKACGKIMGRHEVFMVHGGVIRCGFGVDVLLMTTLLDVYGKVGEFGYARKVFDEMPERDVATWNAMIGGLGQWGWAHEGLRLFYRMCELGLEVTDVTLIGALSACSQLGGIKEGEKVWRVVKNEGLDRFVTVCNAGIDMYCKCGFVGKGYELFRTMECDKTVITWNTMINGFAMHGHGVEALRLLDEMSSTGVHPDQVSYLAALSACNHAGMVEEGYQLFSSMEEKGVPQNLKHYGTVVDLLGRAGRVIEAHDIIASMPFDPDIVLWQTLLGACKTYGNITLAETASRKLVEMGSDSCGDFVLLSNTYATHERWRDVDRVREAMKIRAVKKVPGFSYTELNGTLHRFINGDKNHPEWVDIYLKLDEMMFRVKEYGYVPRTGFVLHDIGEEDKEFALSHHSEKLAVAFALLETSEGAPIQVIKNLRICVDCHEVMKLVSMIYVREIVVRDRTRFHRFKDGVCSCRDYW